MTLTQTLTVLRNVRPRLPVLDLRTARPAPKVADRELLTGDHRAWREAVLQRAGHRCEWVEHGVRCDRTVADHRLYADHVVERQDGGAALDVANGKCLCASHHGLKTFRERARRMARPT
jgi:5-methylcytosine-specific restriction protein A